jgi:uncharacterized membrane protein
MIFINILKKYLEKFSLGYHLFFICFLIWSFKFRKKEQKINKNLIKFLGIYVVIYGCIIFYYGPELFNNEL